MISDSKFQVNIFLAEPRGFCSGVIRAINMVEKALTDFGVPIYVLNEIVHNKHVVDYLTNKGAVFVSELSQVDVSKPLIFSAHGVGRSVEKTARDMGIECLDATCPLVKLVHKQVEILDRDEAQIIVIGKKNHPEIIGVVGQVENDKKVHVIGSVDDAKLLDIDDDAKIGYVTQTTLCIDEVKEIVEYLQLRFLNLVKMKESDICYATTHRQNVIKKVAKLADVVVVIGSKNSSNSNKLRDVALTNGAKQAVLIDDVSELDWGMIDRVCSVGISAGASAPEKLVEELVEAMKNRYQKINIQIVK